MAGHILMHSKWFPTFYGENPLVWLEEVEDIFEELQVPQEYYVDMAVNCLRGAAWKWWFLEDSIFTEKDWCAFSYKLLWHFDPTTKPPTVEDDEIVGVTSVESVGDNHQCVATKLPVAITDEIVLMENDESLLTITELSDTSYCGSVKQSGDGRSEDASNDKAKGSLDNQLVNEKRRDEEHELVIPGNITQQAFDERPQPEIIQSLRVHYVWIGYLCWLFEQGSRICAKEDGSNVSMRLIVIWGKSGGLKMFQTVQGSLHSEFGKNIDLHFFEECRMLEVQCRKGVNGFQVILALNQTLQLVFLSGSGLKAKIGFKVKSVVTSLHYGLQQNCKYKSSQIASLMCDSITPYCCKSYSGFTDEFLWYTIVQSRMALQEKRILISHICVCKCLKSRIISNKNLLSDSENRLDVLFVDRFGYETFRSSAFYSTNLYTVVSDIASPSGGKGVLFTDRVASTPFKREKRSSGPDILQIQLFIFIIGATRAYTSPFAYCTQIMLCTNSGGITRSLQEWTLQECNKWVYSVLSVAECQKGIFLRLSTKGKDRLWQIAYVVWVPKASDIVAEVPGDSWLLQVKGGNIWREENVTLYINLTLDTQQTGSDNSKMALHLYGWVSFSFDPGILHRSISQVHKLGYYHLFEHEFSSGQYFSEQCNYDLTSMIKFTEGPVRGDAEKHFNNGMPEHNMRWDPGIINIMWSSLFPYQHTQGPQLTNTELKLLVIEEIHIINSWNMGDLAGSILSNVSKPVLLVLLGVILVVIIVPRCHCLLYPLAIQPTIRAQQVRYNIEFPCFIYILYVCMRHVFKVLHNALLWYGQRDSDQQGLTTVLLEGLLYQYRLGSSKIICRKSCIPTEVQQFGSSLIPYSIMYWAVHFKDKGGTRYTHIFIQFDTRTSCWIHSEALPLIAISKVIPSIETDIVWGLNNKVLRRRIEKDKSVSHANIVVISHGTALFYVIPKYESSVRNQIGKATLKFVGIYVVVQGIQNYSVLEFFTSRKAAVWLSVALHKHILCYGFEGINSNQHIPLSVYLQASQGFLNIGNCNQLMGSAVVPWTCVADSVVFILVIAWRWFTKICSEYGQVFSYHPAPSTPSIFDVQVGMQSIHISEMGIQYSGQQDRLTHHVLWKNLWNTRAVTWYAFCWPNVFQRRLFPPCSAYASSIRLWVIAWTVSTLLDYVVRRTSISSHAHTNSCDVQLNMSLHQNTKIQTDDSQYILSFMATDCIRFSNDSFTLTQIVWWRSASLSKESVSFVIPLQIFQRLVEDLTVLHLSRICLSHVSDFSSQGEQVNGKKLWNSFWLDSVSRNDRMGLFFAQFMVRKCFRLKITSHLSYIAVEAEVQYNTKPNLQCSQESVLTANPFWIVWNALLIYTLRRWGQLITWKNSSYLG